MDKEYVNVIATSQGVSKLYMQINCLSQLKKTDLVSHPGRRVKVV